MLHSTKNGAHEKIGTVEADHLDGPIFNEVLCKADVTLPNGENRIDTWKLFGIGDITRYVAKRCMND